MWSARDPITPYCFLLWSVEPAAVFPSLLLHRRRLEMWANVVRVSNWINQTEIGSKFDCIEASRWGVRFDETRISDAYSMEMNIFVYAECSASQYSLISLRWLRLFSNYALIDCVRNQTNASDEYQRHSMHGFACNATHLVIFLHGIITPTRFRWIVPSHMPDWRKRESFIPVRQDAQCSSITTANVYLIVRICVITHWLAGEELVIHYILGICAPYVCESSCERAQARACSTNER